MLFLFLFVLMLSFKVKIIMIKSFKMISQKISDKKHDKIKAITPKKTKQTKPQHNMVVIH